MKKIFIFSLMLASFLCSEAKERSLQQKLEIASEVLGERLPSVGGKTSREEQVRTFGLCARRMLIRL